MLDLIGCGILDWLVDKVDTKVLDSNAKPWCRGQLLAGMWMGFLGLAVGLIIMAVSVGAAITTSNQNTGSVSTPTMATPEARVVEYYLPYPGILPDNPIYKLKTIRDRIKLWFAFDESDKAKLELALADKRINAALALAEGNKVGLAVTTATKAEKYLELSTNRVIKLIKIGRDEKSLLLNLQKAIAKHGELLLAIGQKAQGDEIKAIGEAIALNRLLEERVRQLGLEVL